MTHSKDHEPRWDSPVSDRGYITGPTTCSVCGVKPARKKCVNCGEWVTENVASHGSFTTGLHSVWRKAS